MTDMPDWTHYICRECEKAYSVLLPECSCCGSGSVSLVRCSECGSREGIEKTTFEGAQEFLREVHAA